MGHRQMSSGETMHNKHTPQMAQGQQRHSYPAEAVGEMTPGRERNQHPTQMRQGPSQQPYYKGGAEAERAAREAEREQRLYYTQSRSAENSFRSRSRLSEYDRRKLYE